MAGFADLFAKLLFGSLKNSAKADLALPSPNHVTMRLCKLILFYPVSCLSELNIGDVVCTDFFQAANTCNYDIVVYFRH
jgi:hypothetical protein